ncbi:MAG: Gfo/Idh/MocA family oxidoreductase [Candidatus Heimdallarchaeota archaeon]|nr:Gfo/Idh/MocA family oxidoreductase [Candidatus Heimdallarchaeota archaeon]
MKTIVLYILKYTVDGVDVQLKKIKIGVIGAGFIAQEAHIPNYLNNPSVELVGVSDLDKGVLREVRSKFGVKNLFTDYNQLLAKDLDAISICVPTSFHSKLTIDAAEKGISVLCEKPIALNLKEADEMISTCRKNNVKLMIGFNYRFMENHIQTKKYIENGKIGKPFFIHGQFASAGPYGNPDKLKGSFYTDPQRGGGVLYDSGSHIIDLFRWYFGEVDKISATRGSYYQGMEADDVTSVTLTFKNGIVGTITAMWTLVNNWSGMGNENFIKVIGTNGKIVSDFFGPSLSYFNDRSKICLMKGAIQLTPKDFDPKMPFEALNKSWSDEVDHFVKCVKNDKTPSVTGEDGKKALELVLRAYESMK